MLHYINILLFMLVSVVKLFLSDKKSDKAKEFSSETYTRLKYDEKLQYWGKETVSLFLSKIGKKLHLKL